VRRNLINSILLLSLILGFSAKAYAREWTLFVKDDLFLHYYDQENMKTTPKKILQVLIKVVPKSQKGKDLLLAVRKEKMFLMGGYEDYAYTVTALEINCPDKMKAVLESSDFNHKGHVLDTVRDPLSTLRRRWIQIDSDSYPESFYHKALCKKLGESQN